MNLKTKADLAMGAFLCACMIPSVGMFLLPERPAAANQTLAAAPVLVTQDGRLNTEVLDDVTDYVADHFALRQELITANSALEAAVFRTSAQDSVLLGRDGWLFYQETLDDYLHTDPLSERELFSAARTMGLLSEYAGSHGARLVFTVAPNKASLYPQYLPFVGEPLAEPDGIDRLVPLLEAQGVEYIDLFQAFRAQDAVLYHATDSHWTNRGAALAHDTLMTALGLEDRTQWYAQPGRTAPTHRGDLYEMLYPTGGMLEDETQFDKPFTFTYVRPIRSAEDQRIETENPSQTGRLLMFRDSFGNTLYPFLAEEYGHAMFSRAMPYQMALLEETGADTVLIELVERNLNYLLERAPVFPAPQRQIAGSPAVGNASARLAVPEKQDLPGYRRLEGELSGQTDVNSPLYVWLGESLYEASLAGTAEGGGQPFTLYVPEDLPLDGAQVLYLLDGQVCQAGQTEIG